MNDVLSIADGTKAERPSTEAIIVLSKRLLAMTQDGGDLIVRDIPSADRRFLTAFAFGPWQ